MLEQQSTQTEIKPRILCVDDEEQILKSLKRLFRRSGYDVVLASSGKEALSILEIESFDVLISDMRMPEMTGAEVMKHAAENWPDTMRLLLTGYADMESTIAAINEGKVFRYLNKPWQDDDVIGAVESALEIKRLKDERDLLQNKIKQQNASLHELNNSLEEKVEGRTKDLKKAITVVKRSSQRFYKMLNDVVAVLSNVVELRDGMNGGYSRKLASLATSLANHIGLDGENVNVIYFACLLHEIGKVSIPSDYLKKSYQNLTSDEKTEFHQYPMLGEMVLTSCTEFIQTSKAIRSHREYMDGSGYPDGIAGEDIILEARIICVVKDYLDLLCGNLLGHSKTVHDSKDYIQEYAGKKYDPAIVEAFIELLSNEELDVEEEYLRFQLKQLEPGMILAEDILNTNKILLVKKDEILTVDIIAKLRKFLKMCVIEDDFKVRQPT